MHRADESRTSRRLSLAAVAGVLALLCALGLALSGPGAVAAGGAKRPSFVVIQTDDQTLEGLYATFRHEPKLRAMPNTLDLIARRGMTFNRYYVSYPLCCPSRVSLLTGRYAHSNGVKGNIQPNGGWFGFSFRAAARHNLAVWLQQAGYRTIHVGKFLNGYGDAPYSDGTEVPPGWSAWHSVLKADTDHYYYGYTLNDNGQIDGPLGDSGSWETREYGVRDDIGCPFAPANGLPCHYQTDTLTSIADAEMRGTPASRPFYLQIDYTAPHGDFRRPAGPEPAPREYDWFNGAPPPHNSSQGFNEGNVNDKPRFIREAPYLTPSERHTYRVYWDKQLEALRGIDDGVKQLIDTLGSLRRLRNTYVIFTSDNGFFFGEHRLLGGKFLAYEPATHLPFLIRGPRIRPGSKSNEVVGNVDIAPTVLQLAHAEADKSVDGRSMVPFLRDPGRTTLRPYLFESFVESSDVEDNGAIAEPSDQSHGASASQRQAIASILAPPKDYEGILLGPYKYIAWPDGEKELYDLEKDPYELNNIVRTPNFFPIRNYLHRELRDLENCVGRTCREEASGIPLTRRQLRAEIRRKKREQREKRREQRQQKR